MKMKVSDSYNGKYQNSGLHFRRPINININFINRNNYLSFKSLSYKDQILIIMKQLS